MKRRITINLACIKSPIHQTIRGYRLNAVSSGGKHICWRGDYTSPLDAIQHLKPFAVALSKPPFSGSFIQFIHPDLGTFTVMTLSDPVSQNEETDNAD